MNALAPYVGAAVEPTHLLHEPGDKQVLDTVVTADATGCAVPADDLAEKLLDGLGAVVVAGADADDEARVTVDEGVDNNLPMDESCETSVSGHWEVTGPCVRTVLAIMVPQRVWTSHTVLSPTDWLSPKVSRGARDPADGSFNALSRYVVVPGSSQLTSDHGLAVVLKLTDNVPDDAVQIVV